VDRSIFRALGLPCFLIDDNAAARFMHGKPLKHILEGATVDFDGASDAEPTAAQTAAVFRRDSSGGAGEILGTLVKENGVWRYGHVFQGL
jgi:hypothetical protein